jgi:hypothetical protein
MKADRRPLKPRRRKFSLRLLLLCVTLICVYFGTWQATATFGVDDVSKRLTSENNGAFIPVIYKAPLLVATEESEVTYGAPGEPDEVITRSSYYFWFAGWIVKLPFEREWARHVEE